MNFGYMAELSFIAISLMPFLEINLDNADPLFALIIITCHFYCVLNMLCKLKGAGHCTSAFL